MTTKDDDQRDDDEATSMYEARPSSRKAGTLTGLGEDAVKASDVAEEVSRKAAAAPAESVGDYDEEDEATKVRDLPSAVADVKKFGGTMLGLGGEADKAAAPPREQEEPADAGSRKFGGTMVGLGDPDKKEVAPPEPKKAEASDAGSAKTELAPKREEAAPKAAKTLVMEPSKPERKPEADKRPTPKKASTTRADEKGKTLPLGAPAAKAPVKESKAAARSPEPSAEKAAPEAAKGSSGLGLWVGLAAAAAIAGIWFLRGGEEETPEPSSNTEATPAAVADQAQPAKPEPAAAPEPEVRPIAPPPATASAAPSAAEPREEAKEEAKAEKQPEAAPEPVAAPSPPPPKPAKKPPRPAPVEVEEAASARTNSIAPALAARIAIGKSIPVARCRQKPDPSGTADAVVTFASSGQVTAVRVMDQYATTHTGACLRERLKQVTMDAFDGESVTVRVPITLY